MLLHGFFVLLALTPTLSTTGLEIPPVRRLAAPRAIPVQQPRRWAVPPSTRQGGQKLPHEELPHHNIPQATLSTGAFNPSVIAAELAVLAAGAGILLRHVFWRPPTLSDSDLKAEAPVGNALYWPAVLSALLLASSPDVALAADQAPGYSLASYYTTLATYIIALPGLVSLVVRSVKSKVVRKTYVLPGPKAPGGASQKDIAGKLFFYFTSKRSFELKEAGETVTFRGKLGRRRGQAAFLTFCVFLSLLSLGLVLQTIESASLGEGQGLGNWWYAISLLSPLAGKYYIDNVDREQEMQVKIVTDDAEMETEVIVQGDDAEIEGLRLEFDWPEKGMVRVKGLFEDQIKG